MNSYKGFDYNDSLVHHTLVLYPIKTILVIQTNSSLRLLHKSLVNAASSEKNNGHKISILKRDQSVNLMDNLTVILCFW